jgi:sucrose-6-phosphate hydrolase SacC (GH32 family)
VPGNSCIDPANEHWIGHATSTDLDTWVTGDPVLYADPALAHESSHVWAPFVLDHPEGALMAYTGLSLEPSQVICLARSTDPDLRVWHKLPGNPLFPHNGLDWHFRNAWGHVRMGRDPHLVAVGDHHLLAYTGMHRNGCPVVGGMVSHDLAHWEDIGPILYRPMTPGGWMPESVNIQALPDGRWALIASISPGLDYYLADDPHHWHGLQPQRVTCASGDPHDLVAPEIIAQRDGIWLVAFFLNSCNRLFIGTLDTTADPWHLRRVTDPAEIADWLH